MRNIAEMKEVPKDNPKTWGHLTCIFIIDCIGFILCVVFLPCLRYFPSSESVFILFVFKEILSYWKRHICYTSTSAVSSCLTLTQIHPSMGNLRVGAKCEVGSKPETEPSWLGYGRAVRNSSGKW